MARIFIFGSNYGTIRSMGYALESEDHEVYTNLVPVPGQRIPRIVTDVVDATEILSGIRPFPDLIIAETVEVKGAWIGKLLYKMEMLSRCPLVLVAPYKDEEILRLMDLYDARFWKRPFNVSAFVEYVETFFAITC